MRTKQSADIYLSGENLPVGTKPFFVSMPLRRNMQAARFKESMKESYLDDYEKLIESDFDEEKFAEQVID